MLGAPPPPPIQISGYVNARVTVQRCQTQACSLKHQCNQTNELTVKPERYIKVVCWKFA